MSTPGDRDEREADAISDRVMRMTEPPAKPLEVGRPAATDFARACAECEQREEEDARIARKATVNGVAQGAARLAADAVASGGRPLPAAERAFFEPRFGRDFGQVRIHTDAGASQAAARIGALAFTWRQNIAFAQGQYQPDTDGGRRLLAHELTHTLQQSASTPPAAAHGDGAGALRPARKTGEPTLFRACPPPVRKRGGAAGCGICMGGDFGATGTLIHQLIQYQFFFNDPSLVPSGGGMEMPVPTVEEGKTPPFVPEVDLARIVEESGLRVIEIGEIKPFDDAGTQRKAARDKLDDYSRELRASGQFDEVRAIRTPPPRPFPFVEPTRPTGCPQQMINTCLIEPGIYQYVCEPSWADAQRDPACRCRRREEEEERDRQRVRVPRNVPVAPPVTVPKEGPVGHEDRPPQQVPDVPPVTVPPPPVQDTPPQTAPEPPVNAPESPDTVPEPPGKIIPFPGGKKPAKPVIDEDEVAAAAKVAVAAAVIWGLKKLGSAAARRVLAPLEAAAVAALVIFYSNRVHAAPGPGESPLKSLFDAMQKDGVPVDDEMRKRIEADPALKKALENAASTGDLTEAQRAISQRAMEIIAQNPDAFSEEDLRVLAQGMDAASQGNPATQPTVESLKRAIEAKKRGEPIKPIIDAAVSHGSGNAPIVAKDGEPQTGSAQPPASEPAKPKETPLPVSEKYRTALAATPEREKLLRAMIGPNSGLHLTDKITARFLATVPEDLTAAEVEALLDRLGLSHGETEDEVFAKLERAIKEVRRDSHAADAEDSPDEDDDTEQQAAPGSDAPLSETPSAPGRTVPGQAPPASPTAKPAADLTPEQLAKLKRFLATGPTSGVVNPLPDAKDRVVGYSFTRLIAISPGQEQVAGYMSMRIIKVRSLNDFDVMLSPTVFYNFAGQRLPGVWPGSPLSTSITSYN